MEPKPPAHPHGRSQPLPQSLPQAHHTEPRGPTSLLFVVIRTPCSQDTEARQEGLVFELPGLGEQPGGRTVGPHMWERVPWQSPSPSSRGLLGHLLPVSPAWLMGAESPP